ncbi:Selenocysteine-specific elongation factor [compost metagenome]
MLMQLAEDNPVIQVSAFRDAVGLGRKRSIQILEYFDRLGLTRRFGDRRHIRPDNALARSTDH